MALKKSIAVSESGFIFNPATGDSYTVNQVAAHILEYLKEGLSMEEVKQKMLSLYKVDAADLEKDLSDFYTYLQQLDLTTNGKA